MNKQRLELYLSSIELRLSGILIDIQSTINNMNTTQPEYINKMDNLVDELNKLEQRRSRISDIIKKEE